MSVLGPRSPQRQSVPRALSGILRVPALYGVAAAGVVLGLHSTMPDAVMRPVGLLSDATVPMMLLSQGERAGRG
jgi:predicted permease